MRKTKFITLITTVVMLFLLLNTVAFATETTNTETPPTGTVAEMCNLTFRVGYTGDSFSGNIAVYFKDIASDKEYQFLLESDKGYNASEVYGIIANTTYEVTLSYPDMDKYEIVNADGSAIESYPATSTGLNLIWQIKDKAVETVSETEQDTHGEEQTNIMTADEVLNTFIEKTKFIADDKSYKTFLGNWSSASYKKVYLDIEGNTEESWDNMTTYEKACYSLLFTAPKSRILGGNSNTNASDRNVFLNGLQFAKQDLENISGGNAVYDAVVEVWDWHWDNWESKRTFVNLFENTTYDNSDVKLNGNDFELTDEEKAEIEKDTDISDKNDSSILDSSDLSSDERRSELSSSKNFLSIVLDNIVTIIVLVVVGVILLIVYLRNKKRNYEDYDE